MHFVQLISHYVPASRFGGPQRVAHGLGKALVQAGHQVTVCCTNLADETNDLDVALDAPIDVDGVTVYYEPTVFSRYWGFSPKLKKRAARLIPTADFVLVHFHYQYANLIGSTLARRHRKPYFIFAHGSFQSASMRRRGTWKKQLYLDWIERANVRHAEKIIFNAREEQQNSRFGSQGVVLPNGIAPDELNLPPRGGFRARYPQLHGKTLLLFLGRIDYEGKGLDLLLDAVSELLQTRDDFHLVMAGPSEREGLQLTRQHVNSRDLEDHVTFTGMIEGSEKLMAFADADAFLLPSRSEGLSIALLEALCCGIPVLVTDRVGLHELVAEMEAGVVVPATASGICGGLQQLLDSDVRSSMRNNARNEIREHYSWDRIAVDLVDLAE